MDTLKSSGNPIPENYQRRLLPDFLFATILTVGISLISIKGSHWKATQGGLRELVDHPRIEVMLGRDFLLRKTLLLEMCP